MEQQGRKGRKLHLLFFSVITSVAVFWYLFDKVSLDEVLDAVRNISFSWILLFLLFSLSMSVFRTWRYQVILHASGHHAASFPLFLITLVRNFFSDLLPARLGTLIYIYLVKSRLGIPLGPVVSSFAHAFLFDIISLAFLIIPAVLTVTAGSFSKPFMAAAGAGLAVVSISLLLSLPWWCRVGSALLGKISLLPQGMQRTLHTFLADTESHLTKAREQGIYGKVLMLSFAVRVCKYGSLYALLVGLVVPLGYVVADFPVNKVFLGLCSAEFAASLPVSGIAGFGAYEGAWALVFQLLGYPERIAVLTSIAHHLLTQVYGYGLGGFSLLVLLLPAFSKAGEAQEQEEMIEERWFWMKYTAGVLSVGLVAVFLVSVFTVPEPAGAGEKRVQEGGLESSGDLSGIQVPDGRLVYESDGGIFILDTRKKKAKRIAREGRNPRFSWDGELVAFVHDNSVVVMTDGGNRRRVLAKVEKPRTLCFSPDSRSVIFSDGKSLKRAFLESGEVEDLFRDGVFRELSINRKGDRLAVTIKTTTGFKVRAIDLNTGDVRTVSRGCSATISPDGRYITVNGRDHRKLHIYNWHDLERVKSIPAPEGAKFDNHYWSNSNSWLVSTREGERHDIYLHHVPSGANTRITHNGDSDRADFFVSPK